jgi:hypothetical protein
MLRMARISDSVLLYLAEGEGEIASVVIAELPEGLHFGVAIDTSHQIHTYSKPLRYVTGDQPGDPITGASATVTFRSAETRVLDILALAESIKGGLNEHNGNDDPPGANREFTAAEFALQMVQGVEAVEFSQPVKKE